MKTTILAILLSALFAAGCAGHGDSRLAEAGRIVNEAPDSALRILRTVDTARLGRADRAAWYLLSAQAYNRLDCRIADDSLIRPAAEYFARHGAPAARIAAMALEAQTLQHAGRTEEAVRLYTQATLRAERSARDSTVAGQLGSLYHTLGLLHLEQGNDAAGAEDFAKALAAMERTGNREMEQYARFMLSSAQYACGRYAEAVETLAPLAAARDSLPFRHFAQIVTLQNLLIHIFAEDWPAERLLEERARIDLNEIRHAPLRHGPAASGDSGRTLYDITSALVFHRAGQADSAWHYIGRSLERTEGISKMNVGLYTIAAAISHRRGDDRAAYGYAMQYLEKSDSLEKAQQGVQAAELERRVRAESAAELRETRLRYRSWIAALAALLIAGAAAWALAGYRRKLRRREEQLAEQLALVDSYRESHDSLTSRLDATDAREAAVKELLEGRVAAVRDIAATCYTYGEGERLSAKMRELTLSPAMLADVVRMADIYNDRAVTRLREAFPGWTGRNYDFAALVIAGFSPQEISVMLGMTLNGVYTLKSKLKRRIADAPAGGEFLRFFA
ncbi:hypothetical protein ACF3NQ_08145 [Alistipes dispar]|uniref:hypothetical protein n=1 Tax=Alistipes dispar TaxID=2585119 RepID=UPI003BF24642